MPKFLSDSEMADLESKEPKKNFISDDDMEKLEQASAGPSRPGEAALQGFGQAGTLGYLDEIRAKDYPKDEANYNAISKGINKVFGSKLPTIADDDLETNTGNLQKEFEARDKSLLQSNPGSYLGGSLAGALATPSPTLGAGKSIGAIPKIGKLVEASPFTKGLIGAAEQGFLYNPGDEGLKGRSENALNAAEFGAKLGLGIKGGQAVASGLSKVPGAFGKLADAASLHQAGYMLKDLRRLSNRNKTGSVADTIEKEGLVRIFGDTQDVAERSAKKVEESGKKLDKIYSDIGDAQKKLPSADTVAKYDLQGFDPATHLDELKSSIAEKIGDEPGARAAINNVMSWAEDLAVKYKSGVTPSQARVLKAKADSMVNYSKQNRDMPAVQMAYQEAANFIRDKIDKQAKAAEKVGGKDLSSALKSENKRISGLLDVKNTATDWVRRQDANSYVGLLPTIAGGSVLAGSQDFSPEGLAKAGAAALAMKAGRRYGSGLLGAGANLGAKLTSPLEKLSPLAKGGMGLLPAAEKVRSANH